MFTTSYGVPGLQTQVAIPAAGFAAGSSQTITGPAGPPPPFANVYVGDVLTIYDGVPPTLANQQNVTVSAVNRINNTITFTIKGGYVGPGTLNISSAQTQTLQGYYAGLVAQMGQDASAATTGNTTQTSLASSINSVRQSTDGINIDEETQNLVKFQNAYGAAAHVITVLSSMLDDAINLGTGTSF
jgi:flagellar hook-associated protein FlgK